MRTNALSSLITRVRRIMLRRSRWDEQPALPLPPPPPPIVIPDPPEMELGQTEVDAADTLTAIQERRRFSGPLLNRRIWRNSIMGGLRSVPINRPPVHVFRALRGTPHNSNSNMLTVFAGSQQFTMSNIQRTQLPPARSRDADNFRVINESYIEAVYNRAENIRFLVDDRMPQFRRYYMYIEQLGVLLPSEMLDLEPDIFVERIAADITEYLNLVHSNLLASTLNQIQPKRRKHKVLTDKFYYFRYKKSYRGELDRCTVCQEEFRSNQKVVLLHGKCCGFHEKCIQRWFKEKPSCPNCGKEVPHILEPCNPAEQASATT